MEQKIGPNLVSPPSIPSSQGGGFSTSVVMNENNNNNEKVLHIYSQIINSSRVMYRNLLRLLYSADLIDVDEVQKIEGADGSIQEIKTPIPKIQKLPSSNKICTKCRQVYPEEINSCCSIDTIYLDWKPLLNDNGFNQICSIVLANTDEIMSTGNINIGNFDVSGGKVKTKEVLKISDMAIETTFSVLKTITENIYDWSATGKPNITSGQYQMLANMICDHIYWVYTRSIDAYLVEAMKETSKLSIGSAPRTAYAEPQPNRQKSFTDIFFGSRGN